MTDAMTLAIPIPLSLVFVVPLLTPMPIPTTVPTGVDFHPDFHPAIQQQSLLSAPWFGTPEALSPCVFLSGGVSLSWTLAFPVPGKLQYMSRSDASASSGSDSYH